MRGLLQPAGGLLQTLRLLVAHAAAPAQTNPSARATTTHQAQTSVSQIPTICPVSSSRAFHTTPIPPRPSTEGSVNRSVMSGAQSLTTRLGASSLGPTPHPHPLLNCDGFTQMRGCSTCHSSLVRYRDSDNVGWPTTGQHRDFGNRRL
jgi:hypothetical protein